MNKILITGGAGFIGRELADYISNDINNHILIVDNLSTGDLKKIPKKGNIKFINQRIREILNLEEDEILNHNISEISNLKMYNEMTVHDLKQKKIEIRTKDKYLEIHPSPYYEDNDHKGFLLVINDRIPFKIMPR